MQPFVKPLGARRASSSITRPVARRVLIGGLLSSAMITAAMYLVAPSAGSGLPDARPACSGDCSVQAAVALSGADTSAAADPKASTNELVRRVNRLRLGAGCSGGVRRAAALQRAAKGYVEDLGAGVPHVDSVGGTAQDRARRQGYRGNVIELVARGSLQPDEFVAALFQMVNQSDLLDCRFRAAGAAVSGRHLVLILGDR